MRNRNFLIDSCLAEVEMWTYVVRFFSISRTAKDFLKFINNFNTEDFRKSESDASKHDNRSVGKGFTNNERKT